MIDDRAAVEMQIGRPVRAESLVVARCHLGLPTVVRVPPVLHDGTPFPTLFWLTCPLARRRVGRLEGAGGVRSMERRVQANPDLASRLTKAHRRYAAQRDALVEEGAEVLPAGGVGGIEGSGIKCLHAHYADTLAGNENPIGDMVAPWVEPLDCSQRCVADIEGVVVANPEWKEPR